MVLTAPFEKKPECFEGFMPSFIHLETLAKRKRPVTVADLFVFRCSEVLWPDHTHPQEAFVLQLV